MPVKNSSPSKTNTARTADDMSDDTEDDGTRDANDNDYSVLEIDSRNSGSYEEQNTRGDATEEEYDSITFHENDDLKRHQSYQFTFAN